MHARTHVYLYICVCIHVYTHAQESIKIQGTQLRQERFLESQENIINNFMPIDAKTLRKWIYPLEKQVTKSDRSRKPE